MRPPHPLVLIALVPLWVASASTSARAEDPGAPESGERIDDPKLERRLGTRVELAPPAVTPEPAVTGEAPVTAEAPVTTEAPVTAEAPVAAEAEAMPTSGTPEPPRVPRLKLAYRRFTFNQIGAPGTSGPGVSEPFNVLSLDLYPVSSSWRLGLSTQYGWQEGTFRQNGDAFFAESVSLGGQIPGPVLVPFFEAYAGGGFMQRTKPDLGLNGIATAYGQVGVDVGTEVFLARYFCMSFAIGYVHLANGFAQKNVFNTFSADTWSFKLGVGL